MSESLEIVSPPKRMITFNGREIAIMPVNVGNLQDFSLAVRPIMADVFMALEGTGDVLQTFELHGNRMITAVAIATGIDRKELEALDMEVFLKLMQIVVEVNTDFFIRRLIPSMMPLFARAVVAINEKWKAAAAGQT